MMAPDEWIPEIPEIFSWLYSNLQQGTALARRVHRLGTVRRLASVWRTLADHSERDMTFALFLLAVAC